MDGTTRARASAVLAALADLSPSGEATASRLAVSTEWFRWLPLGTVGLTMVGVGQLPPAQIPFATVERSFGERLAALDQVRSSDPVLRVGWLFVAGTIEDERGKRRRVLHPLVTVSITIRRPPLIGPAEIVLIGDTELTPLITDPDERRRLESSFQFGGGALDGVSTIDVNPVLLERLPKMLDFAVRAAAAAGFPALSVVPATDGADELMAEPGLRIVAGVAVFAGSDAMVTSRAGSLLAWSAASADEWTAFHSMYLDPPDQRVVLQAVDEVDDEVDSPFLLTPAQRGAIVASRRDNITLISGAPGTGKSHTIAAIACDALARGENVLVAAKSDATVDALVDLLERSPGPTPVVFGSTDRRRVLADRLAAGQLEAVTEHRLAQLADEWLVADAHRGEVHDEVAARLWAAALVDGSHPLVVVARLRCPGLFDPDADLAEAERLCAAAQAPATGWWSRRRRGRAAVKLRRLAGAAPDIGTERIEDAIATVRTAQAAARLPPTEADDLPSLWGRLADAVDRARDARGRWLEADSRSERRIGRAGRSAIAALARALRSGRSARRDQLAKLKGDRITEALPLWVGTLADIDDLLPPDPALFDLVILDEASSIDQPLAATALLRGARAVIAGDPRQLRQVSFVSDAEHADVVAQHGLDDDPELAARLDVRRNSAFDLAAGAAPVLVLDEHFRSDPHLVEFVAQRLYDGKVHVATRSPRTESIDCIDVARLEGHRDKAGVVHAELAAAVAQARALLAVPEQPSVGIVTPFRAQADALEEAVLAAFTADELEALDLRVGTAHSFQGNERDVVIVSMGLGPEEGATSWRFVEDPHLFAVLMTRARRRLIVLVSSDPPSGGLMAAYLAQADAAPGRPRPVAQVGTWTAAIAEDLSSGGADVVTAYPTGRHVVDIVAGDATRAVGIECQVHPDGPDAHIDRHLSLRRHGWELHDAFESQWSERRGELVVDLLGRLKGTGDPVDKNGVTPVDDREPTSLLDELVAKVQELAAPTVAEREAGTPLDPQALAAMTEAYVSAFRAAGWFREVSAEQLEGLLEVVVVDYQGAPALDVQTEVTGGALLVPGWGISETDPAEVGRGIAEDEIELLDDARDAGEITGWE